MNNKYLNKSSNASSKLQNVSKKLMESNTATLNHSFEV